MLCNRYITCYITLICQLYNGYVMSFNCYMMSYISYITVCNCYISGIYVI